MFIESTGSQLRAMFLFRENGTFLRKEIRKDFFEICVRNL